MLESGLEYDACMVLTLQTECVKIRNGKEEEEII